MKAYSAGTTVSQAGKMYGRDSFVKLSSNENPLGTSPKAAAALAAMDDVHVYVDDDHTELRRRLAEPYGFGVEHVLLGHGSNDVVRTLFSALLSAGDEVVVADPTFSLFPKDAILFGATPVRVPLRDGVHDLEAMLAAVTPKTKMAVVVDPNNPTSTRVERDAFDRFARGLPPDVVLIVDQAYREYMPPGSVEGTDYVRSRPGTIVLRTHSKLYGLASLRFGYTLGDPKLVAYAQRVRLPFNVSRPAAVAALAALDDDEFVRRSLAVNEEGKTYLAAELARLGLHVYPTAANFVAVAVPGTANAAYEALLQRGIVTRSGDALHMPGRLRITIGTAGAERAADRRAQLAGARARMTDGVAVRQGDPDDHDFVRDLSRRTAVSSVSAVRVARYDDVLDSVDRLADFVFARKHDALIAECEGERVGFLLLLYDVPDEVTLTQQAFVAYTAVEPHARGAGVGRALLVAAEAHARAMGLGYMSLMVTEENSVARDLYERSGFVTERRMMTKPL